MIAQGTYPALVKAYGLTESDYGTQAWVEFSVGQHVEGKDCLRDPEVVRTAYLRLTDSDGNPATTQDGVDLSEKSLATLAYLGCTDVESFDSETDASGVGQEVSVFCKPKTKEDGQTVEVYYINTPRKPREKLGATAKKGLANLFSKKLKELKEAAAPVAK